MAVRDGAIFVRSDGFDEIPGLFPGPGWVVGVVGFEDVGFYNFGGGLFDDVFDGACVQINTDI